MATSEVDIFNLALNAIGARSNLAATTEKDRGAEVCRLWYPVVRDQVLRAAPWPSARKTRRLALYAERSEDWAETMPEPFWGYAFSLPEDMIYPRHLSSWGRFTRGTVGNQQVILTDEPRPILTYTFRQTIIQHWEASLVMSIVYGLAANIVMPLTAKPNRAQVLIEQANDLILGARVDAANEANLGYETMPDWITARGYGNPGDQRYYYPFGALLSVAGVRTNVG